MILSSLMHCAGMVWAYLFSESCSERINDKTISEGLGLTIIKKDDTVAFNVFKITTHLKNLNISDVQMQKHILEEWWSISLEELKRLEERVILKVFWQNIVTQHLKTMFGFCQGFFFFFYME